MSQKTKSLKITFVAPGWPNGIFPNGIITYEHHLRQGLQSLGTSVFILAHKLEKGYQGKNVIHINDANHTKSHFNRLIKKAGLRINPAWMREKDNSDNILSAFNKLNSNGKCIDILEMEESFGWVKQVAQHTNTRVVARLHGPWFLVGPALGVKKDRSFNRRVKKEGAGIKQVAGVTAPSKTVLELTKDYYGLKLKSAEVIPSPIEPINNNNLWTIEKCDKNIILFVGRFDRVKGADILLEAFKKVAAIHDECELFFVGPDKGTFVDDNKKQRTFKEFVDYNFGNTTIKQRIKCFGQLRPYQINRLRQKAMVTIVSSRFENFPNVLLEAMSFGCPTIASKTGGIQEIVKDRQNGLFFENENHDDLAKKIVEIMEDEELAAKIGRNAVADCISLYHPKVIAKQTLEFYQTLL